MLLHIPTQWHTCLGDGDSWFSGSLHVNQPRCAHTHTHTLITLIANARTRSINLRHEAQDAHPQSPSPTPKAFQLSVPTRHKGHQTWKRRRKFSGSISPTGLIGPIDHTGARRHPNVPRVHTSPCSIKCRQSLSWAFPPRHSSTAFRVLEGHEPPSI